jgi:hypothetical protein
VLQNLSGAAGLPPVAGFEEGRDDAMGVSPAQPVGDRSIAAAGVRFSGVGPGSGPDPADDFDPAGAATPPAASTLGTVTLGTSAFDVSTLDSSTPDASAVDTSRLVSSLGLSSHGPSRLDPSSLGLSRPDTSRLDPAPPPDPELSRLDTLLNTGPFHEALRAAVAASGLSLDRIQDRLSRRGATVSVATLSSWQSGRFRPERPRSMTVLAVLEEVLHLPKESLSALLGPPRPRGRWLPAPSDRRGLAATWSDTVDAGTALRRLDTSWDESLTRISCHNRLELDEQGRERSMRSRKLLRAEADGADRWITVFQMDNPGPPPRLLVSPPCRTGRVIESAHSGLVVAEVLFDRPLERGETVIVEYTLEHQSPRPYSELMESALHVPVREYVMEVRFDPAALPATCHSFRTADPDSRPQERLLRPDTIGAVHAVALAAGPCRLGIRWSWDRRPARITVPQ